MTDLRLNSAAAIGAPPTASTDAAPFAARAGGAFLACLGVILYGYALSGRGFARIGVAPLFAGELALGVGLAFWAAAPRSVWGATLRRAWPVVLFMAWGACRTVPYLGRDGVDAARDAALWGYGLFALTVLGVVLADPARLGRAARWYRTFAAVLLVVGPVVTLASVALGDRMPRVPGTDRAAIDVKGGDTAVHTAGAVAFAAGVGGVPGLALAVGVPLGLASIVTGRAAMLTLAVGAGMVLWLRPRQPAIGRAAAVVAVGVALAWALDLRYTPSGRTDREISVAQVARSVGSVVGAAGGEEMQGTKEWRLQWWTKIVGYTLGGVEGVPVGAGEHFWLGKGYGVNLADDDGFQVNEDKSLRSPHNGHLSVLARSGAPGLALWVGMLAWWAGRVGGAYLDARRSGRGEWAGLFLFVGTYLACFCVNAAFDVFLEGPMGGVWFWSVLGAGLGAVAVYEGEAVGSS